MGYVPSGSLGHNFYGDEAYQWTDTSGAALTGPAGFYPATLTTNDFVFVQNDAGVWCFLSWVGDADDVTVTFYSSQFVSLGTWGIHNGTNYGLRSVCTDSAGNFYAIGNGAPGNNLWIYRWLAGNYGAPDDSWDTGVTPNNITPSIAVSRDGSTIYWGLQASGTDGRIRTWNTGTGTVGADFVANAATGPCANQGLLVLRDDTVLVGWNGGDVIQYDSSGTLIQTYTIASNNGFFRLAHSKSSTYFWVSGWVVSTNDVYFRKLQSSDGTVLASFTKTAYPSPNPEWDGYFAEVQVTYGSNVVAPTTPTTQLVNSTPCCGAAPTGSTGSNTGDVLPGTGWTPQCTGGGAIPTATDPTDAEDWDTTTATEADVWFQFHLAKFPAANGTTIYRWSKRPMADDGSFKEGRLISFSPIRRAATTIDGDYNIGGFSIVVDDGDGLIRALVEQGTDTEYFLNREGGGYLLSPAGRAAGSTPRTLSRGWCSGVQTLKGRQARLDFSDIVGSQFSGFNLDKEIPTILLEDIADTGYLPDALKAQVLPIYTGEPSDYGAVDVNGDPAARGLVPAFAVAVIDITDPDNGTPPTPTVATPPVITAHSVTGATGQEKRYYGATLITPYGESAMSNIVECDGASVRNVSNYNEISGTFDDGGGLNKVRIWYGPSPMMVGWLDEANYNGAGVFGYFDGAAAWPTATRDENDVIKYMSPPSTGANTNANDWTILAVCLGKDYDLLNYYGSNLANGVAPARVELDSSLHGVEIVGPADPEWPWADPFIVRNGITFTGFLARGNLLKQHLDGTVTFAVNLCGPHDSTSPSLLINQAFRQLAWLLNEHVAKNQGTGYRTGDYWPLEAYANGDTLLNITKFEDAQDTSKMYLGDSLGYLGMFALTEKISVREIIRRFCQTFGCRVAHDHHGRIFPFFVGPATDVNAGRAIREHIEIIDIDEPVLAHDEIRNRETYSYHWDPEGNAFRNQSIVQEDATSIAAHVPGGVSGTPDKRGVKEGDPREMYYTNDQATAEDVITRELARRARRPRYLPVTVDLMGLEQEIADQVRVTHTEGLGSGGDVLMPSLVLEHVTNADDLTVTLTVQDLRTM